MSDEMTSGDDPGVYEVEGEVLGIDPVEQPPAPTPPAVERWRPPGLSAYPERRPKVGNVDVYGALLADCRAANTRASRVFDMTALAHYLGMASPAEATATLCGGTGHQANAIGLGFRSHMQDLGLASGTINRRICTLRRAAKLARRLGAIDWTIEVDSVPEEVSRDMSGPGHDDWLRVLALASSRAGGGSAKGARDLAIVRLLHDSGFRCSEVAGMDLADFDPTLKRAAIVGKGRRSREWITINGPTAAAISEWIKHRGVDPGPLFLRMSKPTATGGWSGRSGGCCGQGRLVSRGIHRLVAKLGKEAGLAKACRPHGLRHSGATRLLDQTNGNIRAVQRWTRHKNVNTVLRYDDSRRDHAGEMAELLGEDDEPGEGLAPVPVPSAPRPKPGGGVGSGPGLVEAPARTKPAPPAPAVVADAPVDPASFAAYVPPGAADQLAEIERLRRRGWSLEKLAGRYGVGPEAIREALEGKGWANRPRPGGTVAVG